MSEEQTWRQQLKGVRAFVETLKEPEVEERDTASLAGKFAEALGHIEDAAHWLSQVNAQFDPEQHDDDIRPCFPATDFWWQAEQAEEGLRGILNRLQRVEPLAPKEKET